jgi:PAS fold
MEPTSFLDAHPRFRRLADYLAAKTPPGNLPGRQHIDPIEIPDLLPFLLLADVIIEPGHETQYRVRLSGTSVSMLRQINGTGKLVRDIMADSDQIEILRDFDEVLATRQPQYRERVVPLPGDEHVAYARVAFPLARDGERIDMMILVFARIDE